MMCKIMQMLIVSTAGLAGPAFAFKPVKQNFPSQQRQVVCSRRGVLGEFQKAFGAAACLLVATTAHPSQSTAATDKRTAAKNPMGPLRSSRAAARFNNEYTDLLHPGCNRRITVEPTPSNYNFDGSKSFLVNFSGTDVGPDGIGPIVKLACTDETIEKYKLRSWSFEGRVNADGSAIDGGDDVHVGRWHVSTEEQPWEGIRWSDNNRWLVKEPME